MDVCSFLLALRAPSAMSDTKSDRKSDAVPPPAFGGEGGGLFARSQTIVLDSEPNPATAGSDRKSVGGASANGGDGGAKSSGDVSSPARSATMAITVTSPNSSVTPIVTAAPASPTAGSPAAADQKRAN